MGLFSRDNNTCEYCKEKMDSYEALISHARKAHHKVISKCRMCGKQFIHEKDRLHHEREEQENKVKSRYR